MATIPRTYLTTSKDNLANVPVVNGQVISIYNSDEVYYDVPSNGSPTGTPVRRKISGVRIVNTLPASPMTGILYIYMPENQDNWDLRVWVNNTWCVVGDASGDTKVRTTASSSKFYLAGATTMDTVIGSLVKNSAVYVQNGVIYGTLSGTASSATSAETATTATTATKATNDVNSNPITSYIRGVSNNGSTITFTKGDGTSVPITVPDTTYSVFSASTAGLVAGTNTTVGSDSTGLFLTGSGWVHKNNIAFPPATSAIKDGSDQTITTTYYKNASFNTTNRNLTLTKGDGTTTTVVNIPDTTYAPFNQNVYVPGLVPAASNAGDTAKFLRGDGTWQASSVSTYQGADASNPGVDGVVPHALAGQQNYYLKGDATWGTVFAQGSAGLVPAPTAADASKFLKGDGTWSASADTKNTAGSTQDTSKLFLVGAKTQDTNPQTYSNNKVYVQSDQLYSNNQVVLNASDLTTINQSIATKVSDTMVADTYDETATYALGDYCMYDDGTGAKLYECTTAISTAEDPFDPTHWTAKLITEISTGSQVSALDDLTDVTITSATSGQVLTYDGTGWVNGSATTSASSVSYDNTSSGLTATDVQDAIDEIQSTISNLPNPMVYRGTLGTGGTISSLPTDGTADVGDTYKVIEAGTYDSQAADVGDTFICLTKTSNANTWTLIPSGDEPDTLADLTDTTITTPTNGQFLKYNGTTSKWENVTTETWLTGTLTTGATQVVLPSASITANSMFDYYTSAMGVSPLTATVDTTATPPTLTLTFMAQASDLSVKVMVF